MPTSSTAMLGARDVPDLLCIPSWEYPKIPRFSEAVKTLFEDLTDHLKGDAVLAVPDAGEPADRGLAQRGLGRPAGRGARGPTDGTPFPWALFYRKDLFDAPVDHATRRPCEELLTIGKQVTDPAKGVWAFNDIFDMVQMYPQGARAARAAGGARPTAA